MDSTQQLLAQTTSLQPTCRRGEGFADRDSIQVDGGTIRGQAVPFGKVVRLAPTLFERFDPGAFHRQVRDPQRVKLCLEHGQVIGRCDSLEETPHGLRFTARISERDGIPEAKRARALLDDDLVDELSIGFAAVDGGTEVTRRDDGSTLVTHRRARLMEISLVPWGMYGRDATLSRALLIEPQEWAKVDELAALRAAQRAWLSEMRATLAAGSPPRPHADHGHRGPGTQTLTVPRVPRRNPNA